jgi:SHS2 domain-containing protein
VAERLIFLSETHKLVYTELAVGAVSDNHLEATVRGVFPEVVRTAVKAATLHEVAVEREPDGRCRARVVLDV